MKLSPPRASLLLRAFTFVELLIAIIIFAFLASLILVAARQANSKADAAKCTASLRGLHATIMLYASDHGATLPPTIASGHGQTYWRRSLLPYWSLPSDVESMSKTPLNCPAVSRVLQQENGNGRFIPYGLNYHLSKVRLALIATPSRKLLATDGTIKEGSLPNEAVSLSLLTNHGRNLHSGGQNILYVDGHVEYFHDVRRLTSPPYTPGEAEDVWTP